MAFDPIEHFGKFNFKPYRHVLVAVSGGSDSLGLLLGLHEFCQSQGGAPRISAVTVDHGLREGAKAEAAGVAALCAKLNIDHVIKRWEGAKPTTGLQAKARQERRSLICQAASEKNADIILTGHTFDDQIETVAMRQKRGAGLGLAGIAPASLCFDDRSDGRPIWIARPLLSTSRADIRNYLSAKNVTWVDDPSNENAAFERIAVRQELATSGENLRQELALICQNAAKLRQQLALEAANLLSSYVRQAASGLLHLECQAFADLNNPALLVLVRTLIAHAGGAEHLGDREAARLVLAQVEQFGFTRGIMPWRTTSNGALIEVRRSGIYFLPDGRKQSQVHEGFDDYSPSATVPRSLIKRAGAAGLNFNDDQTGPPLRKRVSPWADLVPLFDFELANTLSKMVGAGPLPEFLFTLTKRIVAT